MIYSLGHTPLDITPTYLDMLLGNMPLNISLLHWTYPEHTSFDIHHCYIFPLTLGHIPYPLIFSLTFSLMKPVDLEHKAWT